MTTPAAEKLYLAQNELLMENKSYAYYNPNDMPIDSLPVIYGFNNGGSHKMLSAVLLAEDGTGLGGHCCSDECYMKGDLGILKGTRPDRHETFRQHYPNGYRMDFVSSGNVLTHKGLDAAYKLNQEKRELEDAK